MTLPEYPSRIWSAQSGFASLAPEKTKYEVQITLTVIVEVNIDPPGNAPRPLKQ